jgi:hypothetical protein
MWLVHFGDTKCVRYGAGPKMPSDSWHRAIKVDHLKLTTNTSSQHQAKEKPCQTAFLLYSTLLLSKFVFSIADAL